MQLGLAAILMEEKGRPAQACVPRSTKSQRGDALVDLEHSCSGGSRGGFGQSIGSGMEGLEGRDEIEVG